MPFVPFVPFVARLGLQGRREAPLNTRLDSRPVSEHGVTFFRGMTPRYKAERENTAYT